jgi:hypothetical protein
MSTPAAQVRVRLSAEGIKDVVGALKTVERQAKDTASARGLGAINGALKEFKSLLPAIGLGGLAVGFTSLAKGALQNADALGKLSEKTGAAVEDASALVVAGRLVDVNAEQVKTSLSKAAIAVGELAAGSKTAARSFAQLGLTAKDFQGRDTGQAFELIAQRVTAIEDPFRRAEAAAAIFGSRLAADLMPLLNAVADEGLANLRTQAEDLGLLITGDLAAAADAAGDSFDIIQLQAEGLATSFVAGLAPSIVAAMGDFSSSIKGDGVEEMKRFGAETGRVLRTVVATFRLFYTVVSGLFQGLGNQIGAFFATFKAFREDGIGAALRVFKDAGEQSKRDSEAFKQRVQAAVDGVVKAATSDPPTIPVKLKPDKSALAAEVAAAMAAADREANAGKGDKSAEREAEMARREAERLAEEQRRRDQSAGEARFDLEQRILEASGRGSEAKLRALDAELAKVREILAASKGGVSSEDEAKIGQVRALEATRIALEEALAVGNRGLDELAKARTRIEQDVDLGIISQYEGTQRILALEKDRLATLQAIAAQAMAAAQASGDPEAIAQAQALGEQVRQVEVSVLHASDAFATLKEGAQEALHGGLTEVLTNLQNYESVGDVFKSLASSVASSLQRIAAEMLATYIQAQLLKAAMSLFGGFGGAASGGQVGAVAGKRSGGIVGYAGGGQLVDARGGGRLSGPGTGTSDSIPAITTTGRPLLVSNGEFVVREAIVRRPGVLEHLKHLNAGMVALSTPLRGLPRRLRGGGLTGGELRGETPQPRGGDTRIVNVLDPQLMVEAMMGPAGEKVILNHIRRNKRGVSRELR